MSDYQLYIACIFAGFAVVEIAMGRFLHRPHSRVKDVVLEVAAGLTVPMVIVPTILVTAPALLEQVVPGCTDAWAHWPWPLMFVTLLLADDLTQYGWHRLTHCTPWLYALHRAHHSAQYMSVRIVYRNSLIYYALMPGLWLSAMLIELGFGPVYLVYVVAKMTVIISAHSSVPWDQPLLENRYTRPLMWLVARVISTPMTHSAHHGQHRADGVTHYRGNYGNFLFLWDILFSTAKISNARPKRYGLENVEHATWHQELIWPFGQSSEPYRAAAALFDAETIDPESRPR